MFLNSVNRAVSLVSCGIYQLLLGDWDDRVKFCAKIYFSTVMDDLYM